MPNIDLSQLATRESEQVEWKLGVADIEDVLRTITAFANDYQNLGGGYVVCGAEESTDEHGFQKVRFPGLTSSRFKEVEGKVMTDALSKIEPPVTPIIEELRDLGQNEKAVQVINQFMQSHPSALAIPPTLYDMRARAKIDLAKKCMDMGKNRMLDKKTCAKALDQCRDYLDEAEADILKALQMETSEREKEFIQKDLDFVRQFQEKAKKRPSLSRNHSKKHNS